MSSIDFMSNSKDNKTVYSTELLRLSLRIEVLRSGAMVGQFGTLGRF